MAFSLACDADKTTLRIEGEDSNVTFDDIVNAGVGSVGIDGGGSTNPSRFVLPNHVHCYVVTGTLNPDITGRYLYAGIRLAEGFDEDVCYRKEGTDDWWLWWNGSQWYITQELGAVAGAHWDREDPDIEGDYTPDGGATGTATVTAADIPASVYRILKNIEFGDGTNALTFYSKNETVHFDNDRLFTIKANATLQLGEIAGNYCINGASWSWEQEGYILNSSDGILKIYGSKISYRGSGYLRIDLGTIDFRNSIFTNVNKTGRFYLMAALSSIILKDVYFNNWINFLCYKTPDTCEGLWIHYAGIAFTFNAPAITLLEPKATDETIRQMELIGSNQTATFKNPQFTLVRAKLQINQATGKIVSQFTCDIHIVDKDGVNLEDVTVTCEDKDNNEVFSVQTNVNGVIAQQTITYRKWEGTDETETEYSPHKFTFSKNGYTLLVMENVTVDARINWDVEVKFPERIRARMANPGRLAILR